MKKSVTLLLSLFVLVTFSQQEELTLNDAVLGFQKGLYPKSLASLQSVKNTNNFVYRSGRSYLIIDKDDTVIDSITLPTLQKTIKNLTHLPRLMHINENTITFKKENSIVVYDYKKNTIHKSINFDKKAKNIDFNNIESVAYTIDNNLLVASNDVDRIVATKHIDKNIVSGQAIARYEFGISKGTFWSPKGNFLAFYEKDETNVTTYPLVDQTTYPATLNEIKYPMAGQGSELAKIGVFNMITKELIYLKIDTSDERYLTNLSWSPDEKFILVAEVNRAQDYFSFSAYSSKTGKIVKTLFTEANKRWVEPENDAVFLPNDEKKFLWLSERDGFKNLYLYSIKGKLKKQLTHFKFPIKSILGFDKSGENVIVTATGKDGRETHVYKVNALYGEITKITSKKGTHRTQLNGDYLIDNFSNLETPREISIINVVDGEEKQILKSENPLKNYKLGKTEFMTLTSKDGFDLYSRIIKPANFDYTKKYPVLIYVYGGTHAQLVTNSWLGGSSLWMQWFATKHNYIIFTLDNRGSENRGFAFESIIHREAGKHAIEDQLTGLHYLKSLQYIDTNRIAVHGWSYGGFMASSMILRNPNLFTTAVAGGPVTDWKYYEVMYGERYMDTPQENPEGYANARVGKYLDGFNGKLLLIHGSVDPTVVPQHSMSLLKEAVDKEVQLDFFTYPMHPHNVRGKDRVQLMQKVLDYVLEHNK